MNALSPMFVAFVGHIKIELICVEISTYLREHKLRTKQFYTKMKKESNETLYFCVYLQEILPKVIRDSFEAQEILLYLFYVTEMSNKTRR